MRISDWSSDVCSSDLGDVRMIASFLRVIGRSVRQWLDNVGYATRIFFAILRASGGLLRRFRLVSTQIHFIGNRLEERREGKSVSVRVDHGGRRLIKKKTTDTSQNQIQLTIIYI